MLPPLERIEKTPTNVTLIPGVTLSTRHLSTVTTKDLGISPVGTSSGASWILRTWWSLYWHSSGTTMYGSNGHFSCNSQSHLLSDITPPSPGLTSFTFWWPQFLHLKVIFEALIYAFEAEVMIPGTTINLFNWLDCKSQSIHGFSKELTWTWKAGGSPYSSGIDTL